MRPFVDCRCIDLRLKHCTEFIVDFCWMKENSVSVNPPNKRPLSPHIGIYRPLINMVMSIFHRISGSALYFGMVFLAWWLISVATGPDYFAVVQGFLASIPGRLILFAFTWALMLHALGGIRHFIWDTGRGYELGTVDLLSWLSLFGSIILTLLIWYFGYKMIGAF